MQEPPDRFRQLKDFSIGAGESVDRQLGFSSYGVFVQNATVQWLYLASVGIFVPPNGVGSIPLGGTEKATMYFAAPPGFTQPGAVAGQKALVFFLAWPVPFSMTPTLFG